jgi:hypothetical protein
MATSAQVYAKDVITATMIRSAMETIFLSAGISQFMLSSTPPVRFTAEFFADVLIEIG